jgi:LysM repeat protein
VASWDIGPIRRKNGARLALVGALLALAAASGCADLETRLESRKARHEAQRLSAPAYHTVRPGETLGEIAKRYRVDVHRLARANDLRDTDRVSVGRRLEIPITRIVHRVEPGETLQGIANRYRVRVSTIAYLNRMGISRHIEVGQRLVIPRQAAERADTSRPRNAVSAAPPAEVAAPKRAPPAAPRADATEERLARARNLVDRAVADYRAARFDEGIEQAWAAEDVLRPIGDRPDARKLSARAAFVAGSAQAARGDEDRATESFARVHELDPEFEPPNGWLSPRLETLYTEAQSD